MKPGFRTLLRTTAVGMGMLFLLFIPCPAEVSAGVRTGADIDALAVAQPVPEIQESTQVTGTAATGVGLPPSEPQPSLPADTAASAVRGQEKKELSVIRRNFNHRQQVALAVGMMCFIAIIMTTTQNWNPQ